MASDGAGGDGTLESSGAVPGSLEDILSQLAAGRKPGEAPAVVKNQANPLQELETEIKDCMADHMLLPCRHTFCVTCIMSWNNTLADAARPTIQPCGTVAENFDEVT